MKKIGIYGGTFDPIHNGHVRAALAFLCQSELDLLYIMPAANPPHKKQGNRTPAEQRLRMCELAFCELCEFGNKIIVSDYEIRQGGASYTVLTLRYFEKYADEIELLCGTDMFLSLDSWYEAPEIFRRAKIAYVRRESDASLDQKTALKAKEYEEKYGARVRRIEIDPLELASSEIRKDFESENGGEDAVPYRVAKYIKENRLYK